MHAVKGGWVGQTFALSKRNESGGRKSRIRISKKERKEMVESFIKKYQSLNSGSFPSLNLTHKEVGGSFYTIREIVREIIQENRVLGPAKPLPEEQNSDKSCTQYPLGTVSSEPGLSVSMLPNDSTFVSDQNQDSSEELYLISKGFLHQGHDNGKIIDASYVPITSKESDEIKAAVDQASEQRETKKSTEEMIVSRSEQLETTQQVEEVIVSRSKVTQMTDVAVETFPLQPGTQPTDYLDVNSGEVMYFSGSLFEKDVKKMPLGSECDASLSDGIKLSDNLDKVENLPDSLLEEESRLTDHKAVKTIADIHLENSNSSSTKDDIAHDSQVNIDVEVTPCHIDVQNVKTKVVNAANSSRTNTPNSTSITEQKITQIEADARHGGSSQKAPTPTLERIKIESWESASNKSMQSKTHPVVAAFKSFVASFAKFWSG